MIISKMSSNEIWKNYMNDKPELDRRIDSYVSHNIKEIRSAIKNSGGTYVLPEPRTTLINKNRYRISMKFEIHGENLVYDKVVYTIIQDVDSGKPEVILIPTIKSYAGNIIKIRSKVFKKMYPDHEYFEAVDLFFKRSATYTAHLYPEYNDERYNCVFNIGSGFAGLGRVDNDGLYNICSVYSLDELKEIGESLGFDGDRNVMEIYYAWRNNEKTHAAEIDWSGMSEEEKKKKEIELAWNEYV